MISFWRAKVLLSERNAKFIWAFPSASAFGKAKGTIKRSKNKKDVVDAVIDDVVEKLSF